MFSIIKKIKGLSSAPIVIVERNTDGSIYIESKSLFKSSYSLISRNHPEAAKYLSKFELDTVPVTVDE